MFFKANHYTPLSANLYSRIKRRMGLSLRGAYYQRDLVPTRKQITYKLPGTTGGLLSPKRVPRLLFRQNNAFSNRQHNSSCLYKQGRRHKVLPTVCPIVEDSDLVLHSGLAECG